MTEKDDLRVTLKLEMQMALEEFKRTYKKVSSGIDKIYSNAVLTDDLDEVQNLHKKFFGYILKSKNAKTKLRELIEDG